MQYNDNNGRHGNDGDNGERRRADGPSAVGWLAPVVALLTLALLVPGCGSGVGVSSDGVVVDGNRDGTLTSSVGEPNDSVTDAIVAVFDEQGVARLEGSVARRGDLDVFRLGELSTGDRVIVDTDTAGSVLDVSIALFDDEMRLVTTNDDRASTDLDAYVDWVTRHAGPSYYLVVTHSAFAAAGMLTGSYRVDVSVTPGSTVPPPAAQVLRLDFSGAEVDSPVLGTMTLDPLDAADISPVYAGQTEALIAAIVDAVEQNFERFDVVVITSDDPPLADGTSVSNVFFGGFSPDTFGIAEDVDLYNVDRYDDAIIYTQMFAPEVFSFTPSVGQLGLAIGNIASHEAGHLVGLNHVSDDLALMDDQSPADAFIADQEFKEAPLSADIMSIGTQNAPLLLSEIVGPPAESP